ncbi:hypothetical protein [Streptomyces sp. LMG1-1-1.1]|uniref:hypothetical protein n=1 Tax=Streptomyces sp. LMG1-1-1.1 TaxID=3135245 RepID=UPI00346735FD
MRYVVTGVAIAFSLAVAISGVVELVTGWIHPWERARVLRPVPHGIGQVLVGGGLCCFFGVVAITPTGSALATLMAVGASLFLPGTALIGWSRFPDR